LRKLGTAEGGGANDNTKKKWDTRNFNEPERHPKNKGRLRKRKKIAKKLQISRGREEPKGKRKGVD